MKTAYLARKPQERTADYGFATQEIRRMRSQLQDLGNTPLSQVYKYAEVKDGDAMMPCVQGEFKSTYEHANMFVHNKPTWKAIYHARLITLKNLEKKTESSGVNHQLFKKLRMQVEDLLAELTSPSK